jgi:hypothetical protein
MLSAILTILLLHAVVNLLREEKAREHRKATQRDLPREQLLPRHYKSFVDIERTLWEATEPGQRTPEWEKTRIKLRGTELQAARDYVRGLREDFAQANRIFSVVIGRSPDEKILKQLEWHRMKIEFPYYASLALVRFRLRMDLVSPKDLHRLTQHVATMAYEVRSMLQVFENGGHGDFVESLLREY